MPSEPEHQTNKQASDADSQTSKALTRDEILETHRNLPPEFRYGHFPIYVRVSPDQEVYRIMTSNANQGTSVRKARNYTETRTDPEDKEALDFIELTVFEFEPGADYPSHLTLPHDAIIREVCVFQRWLDGDFLYHTDLFLHGKSYPSGTASEKGSLDG